MKTPNMIRLLEISIHVFTLTIVWRGASAMMIGGVAMESLKLTQGLESFAIPAAILIAFSSLIAYQLGLRRWRKLHHGVSELQAPITQELQKTDDHSQQAINELRKQLVELNQENIRLIRLLQETNVRLLQDTLTGIPNRLAYEEWLQQEFQRWIRFGNPLTFLIWDIDHFKQINDQYGHATGDLVLRNIASQLAGRIRSTDFVARFGGEEFVMLLPGADMEAALQLANQIRVGIAEFDNAEMNIPVTISCGLTDFQPGDSPQSVFDRADRALYQAKREGRNRCTTG